jgi:hypothetical protein
MAVCIGCKKSFGCGCKLDKNGLCEKCRKASKRVINKIKGWLN